MMTSFCPGRQIHVSIATLLSIQLFDIVDHLHKCKIIHGDIKPDNFVLFYLPTTDSQNIDRVAYQPLSALVMSGSTAQHMTNHIYNNHIQAAVRESLQPHLSQTYQNIQSLKACEHTAERNTVASAVAQERAPVVASAQVTRKTTMTTTS
ncbi:hypothetical protein LSTR_LSTR007008 [Laodelphax striatellus]|uniref:Protein kinase domain-containing protein n=1 Tax=Laodelphax striatellus TaxID=195883 RepID=A0A482WJX3_LAOST|nr:hypothetical protein LSTR_LSTR007008 [Laodelphax striatellus]